MDSRRGMKETLQPPPNFSPRNSDVTYFIYWCFSFENILFEKTSSVAQK